MSTESKLKYIKFCEETDIVPIFSQAWWLDAICGADHWDVCIYEKKDRIAGAWPYYKIVKLGQPMLVMPVLTKFLGIYIDYPDNMKLRLRNSYEKEVIRALLRQLPYRHLEQNFHYSFSNWLPLYWAGFSQQTSYSYSIKETDIDKAYSNLKSSVKRDIKNAGKVLEIVESNNVEIMYGLVQKTYEAKNKTVPFKLEQLKSIDRACTNCKKLLLAQDKDGNIHAAIYLVWDEMSYYYLIAGSNFQFKGSNANSLLLWHGIQGAVKSGKSFDFEGSMIESIERYFSSFGALQKPYSHIIHTSSTWLKIYFFFKHLRS